MSIVLSLAGRTVEVQRRWIPPGGYERTVVQVEGAAEGVEYSAARTPRVGGSNLDAPLLWTISAIVPEPVAFGLQALYSHQQRLKAESRTGWEIGMNDACLRTVDYESRQRAIVMGTEEIAVVGGGVAYFGQFSVLLGPITLEPVANPDYPWRVTFSLYELDMIRP